MKIKAIFLSGICFLGIVGCAVTPHDYCNSLNTKGDALFDEWGHGKNPWMLDSEKKYQRQIVTFGKDNTLKLNH